ncbi:S8 family serine peptidase [Aestuariivita boseongensis]|uniref:S8 family serine peptidase n=1 Tax=Aestuariivita boseongensis TaxID=1470562 RepID=UPI0006815EFF|nr:S8 family serine peptidase [Aestuariivita boseongensis]
MTIFKTLIVSTFALSLLSLTPSVADACNPKSPKCNPTPDPEPEPDPDPPAHTPADDFAGDDELFPGAYTAPNSYFSWMHEDVGLAHSLGFDGTGSHIVVLDNFGGTSISGDLEDNGNESRTHGGWTTLQARLVAPGATWSTVDQPSGLTYETGSITDSYSGDGLQVVNLSFGLFDPEGKSLENYSLGTSLWDSVVTEAHAGRGVFVKAAGNLNGQTVDEGTLTIRTPRPTRMNDYLNLQLRYAPGAIYVGALDGNGSAENPATIASYSTIAGSDTGIQDMFVVAGVEAGITGLSGTSFAAPIVAGYAAMVGNKYDAYLSNPSNTTTPGALVVDRLLETARTDTIADFGANGDCTAWSGEICTRSSIYGMGEADLSRAIAPDIIPN